MQNERKPGGSQKIGYYGHRREAEIFFMLENKRFEISCCLFLMYLVKKDLTDKQDYGNEKSDTY